MTRAEQPLVNLAVDALIRALMRSQLGLLPDQLGLLPIRFGRQPVALCRKVDAFRRKAVALRGEVLLLLVKRLAIAVDPALLLGQRGGLGLMSREVGFRGNLFASKGFAMGGYIGQRGRQLLLLMLKVLTLTLE